MPSWVLLFRGDKWVDTWVKGPTKLVPPWRKEERLCPQMEQISSSSLKCCWYPECFLPGSMILSSGLYFQLQEGNCWSSSNGSLSHSTEGHILQQWFSTCGPWTSVGSTWVVTRSENCQNPSQTSRIRNAEGGGQESVFQETLQRTRNACSGLRTMALQLILIQKSGHSSCLWSWMPRGLQALLAPYPPPYVLLPFCSRCICPRGPALTHLFQELFSFPVGKQNRLMLKRIVFRGRHPLVWCWLCDLCPRQDVFIPTLQFSHL